jgi:quinoprotein glucose dehydrogenase
MRTRASVARATFAALGACLLMLTASGAGAPKDQGWAYYGGDPGGQKYSTLTDINRANVQKLALAWAWRTGETPLPEFGTSPGMFETTPLEIDGVLYFSTPYNRIIALEAASGRELWRYDPSNSLILFIMTKREILDVRRAVALW